MRWVCLVALALSVPLVIGVSTRCNAEELLVQSPEEGTADGPVGPPHSPRELEAAIRTLTEASDEQLGKIVFDLTRLEDLSEQQRLQQLLEERLQEFTKTSEVSPDQSENEQGPPEAHAPPWVRRAPHDDLSMRIETLNLGPQATVEDLRARDEIVSAIAGISDPIQRDQLLKRLDEREQGAQLTNPNDLLPAQQ